LKFDDFAIIIAFIKAKESVEKYFFVDVGMCGGGVRLAGAVYR
jgi:hypothetical protein